jgi:SAM-dependent methyltransferase
MTYGRCATRHATALFLALLFTTACRRDVAGARPQTPASADTLHFPAPDRPISSIVAARWSDEGDRDRFGEAAKVIQLSGVRTGMTVADIGAGDGYYVARLSPVVGASGHVLGEDIVPQYLALLSRRVASEHLGNVSVVAGTQDDPRLAARSVDVALLIHMYHEITRPFELLWYLSVAVKPGGTVSIVDQDGPTDRHGTPRALLRCELGALGFEQARVETLNDGAYVAVFRAPDQPVPPVTVRDRLTTRACAQR